MPRVATKEVIKTWDLTKRYGKLVAVDGVTLSVPQGSIFGFLGPNGAGKSTFVKMLLGLVHPSSGWAEVLDNPPLRWEKRGAFGYLPENFRFPPWLSGLELLRFHATILKIPATKRDRRINEILEKVGLSQAGNQMIGTYSKGMQQRIGLAQAMLGELQIIFLDEPTSAMDPVGRRNIRELLVELRNQGKTIFLNSHLLADVEMVCDYVAIINKGKLIYQGALGKLLKMETRLAVEVDKIPNGLIQELSERFGPAMSNNGSLSLDIALKSNEVIPEVARFLVGKGLNIYRLESSRSTLEEVFIKLVKEKGELDD